MTLRINIEEVEGQLNYSIGKVLFATITGPSPKKQLWWACIGAPSDTYYYFHHFSKKENAKAKIMEKLEAIIEELQK